MPPPFYGSTLNATAARVPGSNASPVDPISYSTLGQRARGANSIQTATSLSLLLHTENARHLTADSTSQPVSPVVGQVTGCSVTVNVGQLQVNLQMSRLTQRLTSHIDSLDSNELGHHSISWIVWPGTTHMPSQTLKHVAVGGATLIFEVQH